MASVSVEAMRSMIMIMMTTDDLITSTTTTSSSTAADTATAIVVSRPVSPSTFERESEDEIIRSTNNHTILSIPLSAPMMPMMALLPMMPGITTPSPTPSTIRRRSTSSIVIPRRRVNNKKKTELSNVQLPVVPTLPTKRMKRANSKQVLRQIKRGLLAPKFLFFSR
mmetsp:Transcript_54693/g.61126  ORF Transcript_54693/g.61126 Transcript_54693/m.61126 type:complete len:167 (+) Transcript_54693:200-700(+)